MEKDILDEESEKIIETGRMMFFSLVGFFIFSELVNAILGNFSLIRILLGFFLFHLTYHGHNWIRYILVTLAVIGAALGFIMVITSIYYRSTFGEIFRQIISLIFTFFSIYVLFLSKSSILFFERQNRVQNSQDDSI